MAEKKTSKAKKEPEIVEETATLYEAVIADRVAREIYRDISNTMRMNSRMLGSLVSINIVYEVCRKHMAKG